MTQDSHPNPFTGAPTYRPTLDNRNQLTSEALPLAAEALRNKEGQDSLSALIIDLRHLLMLGQLAEARNLAEASLARHPHCSYLFLILSVDQDNLRGYTYARQMRTFFARELRRAHTPSLFAGARVEAKPDGLHRTQSPCIGGVACSLLG
jgi:hypothetical protein